MIFKRSNSFPRWSLTLGDKGVPDETSVEGQSYYVGHLGWTWYWWRSVWRIFFFETGKVKWMEHSKRQEKHGTWWFGCCCWWWWWWMLYDFVVLNDDHNSMILFQMIFPTKSASWRIFPPRHSPGPHFSRSCKSVLTAKMVKTRLEAQGINSDFCLYNFFGHDSLNWNMINLGVVCFVVFFIHFWASRKGIFTIRRSSMSFFISG